MNFGFLAVLVAAFAILVCNCFEMQLPPYAGSIITQLDEALKGRCYGMSVKDGWKLEYCYGGAVTMRKMNWTNLHMNESSLGLFSHHGFDSVHNKIRYSQHFSNGSLCGSGGARIRRSTTVDFICTAGNVLPYLTTLAQPPGSPCHYIVTFHTPVMCSERLRALVPNTTLPVPLIGSNLNVPEGKQLGLAISYGVSSYIGTALSNLYHVRAQGAANDLFTQAESIERAMYRLLHVVDYATLARAQQTVHALLPIMKQGYQNGSRLVVGEAARQIAVAVVSLEQEMTQISEKLLTKAVYYAESSAVVEEQFTAYGHQVLDQMRWDLRLLNQSLQVLTHQTQFQEQKDLQLLTRMRAGQDLLSYATYVSVRNHRSVIGNYPPDSNLPTGFLRTYNQSGTCPARPKDTRLRIAKAALEPPATRGLSSNSSSSLLAIGDGRLVRGSGLASVQLGIAQYSTSLLNIETGLDHVEVLGLSEEDIAVCPVRNRATTVEDDWDVCEIREPLREVEQS